MVPPTFIPSAEIYFATVLQDSEVWPITTYMENYDENILFSVIEILFDHIAEYDYLTDKIKDDVKQEFAEQINNIIRAYKDGYYLEPTNGHIRSTRSMQSRLSLLSS